MEKNIVKKSKNAKGITIIALVITIIVLLILAGVSLSMVLNQNGIFKRANDAKTLNGKGKSKEELTIALSDAAMKKYTESLNSDELNDILNKIGKIDEEDNTKVTVEGHIWKIDRDEFKIVNYLGEDDGIEINYTIEGNDNWSDTPNITVKVSVRNRKGTLDINTIKITKDGTPFTDTTIQNNGDFELKVTEKKETIFTVSAQNSEGRQSTPRTIKVTPKKDTTPPTISGQTATLSGKTELIDGMEITIRANAVDHESKLKSFTYTVTCPEGGSITEGVTGNLESGVAKVLTTTLPGRYTITFTATDNENNTATVTVGPIITSDAISVADAKRLVKSMSELKKYIGTKVDYKTGETWQIFYYDQAGEFGTAGTLYLKRAYGEVPNTALTLSTKTSSTDQAVEKMRKMNPKWRDSSYSTIDKDDEKACVWLCDGTVWNKYKNDAYSSYAIGSPSLEMYMKAYNVYKTGNKDANNLVCKIGGNGYRVGTNGTYTGRRGKYT